MFELNHTYIAGLVKRVQKNDDAAFSELYALTHQKQYQFARNYLKDEHLAQDALQEAYILALKNINKLQEPQVFVAWLKQINFRVCYSMMQKARNYTADNLDDTPETSFLTPNNIENPEDAAIRHAESRRLTRALEKLPEQERTAILLRYTKDMKLEAISREMGCSLSTVKRLINRACLHLQDILKKEE